MDLFFKNYDIVADIKYSEAVEIFRSNLDDMTKKGYSMSGNSVIYNSEHKAKYFSGEFKDGRFVVRQTDGQTDDFYYTVLPKHEISFEKLGDSTKIHVKSTSILFLIIFILLCIISVFSLIGMAVVIYKGLNLLIIVPCILPVIIAICIAVIINNQINYTKYIIESFYR